MNRNLIWIKIEGNYYKILLKLNNIGINILDSKKQNDWVLLKIEYEDYLKIKKYLVSYKTTIHSKVGIDKYLDILKKYIVFIVASIIGIILLFFINNIIFKVDIKTNNESIKELLTEELKEQGLSRLRLKKSHKDIEKIVEKILKNNKETLKWLEIKFDGLIMIVNVTETTKEENLKNYNNCNIVASKDAKITSLNLYRGTIMKEINDYVLKGDVIFSGNVIHNEEVKNTVCANGEVYGEVWYKVKVEIPFYETKVLFSGKNRYNLSVKINDKTYNIFKSRIKNKKIKNTNLYKLNDFEINLVKEMEYTKKVNKISVNEAYQKGISKALEKINLLLDEEEEILVKKVLKKEVNNSKIYLEIFIVTKEEIGELQVVREEVLDDNRIN